MKNRALLKTLACICILCGTTSVYAGLSDWMKPFVGPGQKISTLIVTGNYAKPRILAELIQSETRQPILLLPAEGSDIYFLPPDRNGDKAMKIKLDELRNFINFIGSKQIILLGDNEYIPERYSDEISDTQTVCRITSRKWQNIANTVGKFLNLPNLPGDYKNLEEKMTSEVNYERAQEKETKPSEESMLPSTEDLKNIPAIETSAEDKKQKNVTEEKTAEPFVFDASQK
ncbi:MAG: hypothetical protein K9L78_03270 [Victivallales bacterium]|nr:hypothetical protein [Victivallales bacterium]MCF7889119.1 hypothetical protein [Victivallales bacterium]